MKAVVFDGPFQVSLQERPVPQRKSPFKTAHACLSFYVCPFINSIPVLDDKDIIIKVRATALCGSELHVYRGHEQDPGNGFIMGHEFAGVIVEAGPSVKTVQVGDNVVSPFTVCCGECFYCKHGFTSRCDKCQLFGSRLLDGGQAEYVRVPLADSTVLKAPDTISDRAALLMADIFPTGYFGVKSAIAMSPSIDVEQSTVVVVGCGPVGLCAILCALHRRPRHVFAIDSVESRLEVAQKLGAEALNFQDGKEVMRQRVMAATDGRGADMIVEAVGHSPALRTAFELVRPFGAISSIGVHNAEIPWTGREGYGKNIRLQMGRCPVRHVFGEALAVLEQKQKDLEFMFDQIMPLSEAKEGYALFDKMKVQNVIFVP
ncbi:putative zinc-binding alcohol dehydrogenase [Tolypocladium ophioglossoides CBS 100239]|uniref:Putative zinc-binding alcohol dehydrogenase n=1 Tax=Tolypocladium ophioglossoides (strain CBS 100239) TaxID=1163406 RepID=A0A0L0NFC7_TOLOC|nr:putative zinc-binding alcohol dehydrogenase [Tolypocladium ophioglossoides CBS 100239]